MNAAQFRVLRACFEVCDRDTRRVRIRDVEQAIGRRFFTVYHHLQALIKRG